MDELSPEARRALETLRGDLPDDATRARMRQRMLAASLVAAGAGTMGVAAAQAASASASTVSVGAGALSAGTGTLSTGKLLLVVASLSAVGTSAVTLHRQLEKPPVVAGKQAPAASLRARDSAYEHHGTGARASTAPTVEETFAPPLAALPIQAKAAAEPLKVQPNSTTTTIQSSVNDSPRRSKAAVTPMAPAVHVSAESIGALEAESHLLLDAFQRFEAGETCEGALLLLRHDREFGAAAHLAPERQRMRARFFNDAFDPDACNEQKGNSQ